MLYRFVGGLKEVLSAKFGEAGVLAKDNIAMFVNKFDELNTFVNTEKMKENRKATEKASEKLVKSLVEAVKDMKDASEDAAEKRLEYLLIPLFLINCIDNNLYIFLNSVSLSDIYKA